MESSQARSLPRGKLSGFQTNMSAQQYIALLMLCCGDNTYFGGNSQVIFASYELRELLLNSFFFFVSSPTQYLRLSDFMLTICLIKYSEEYNNKVGDDWFYVQNF